jgi:hypothetical protein
MALPTRLAQSETLECAHPSIENAVDMSAAVVPVRRAALAFIFITVLLDILAFG